MEMLDLRKEYKNIYNPSTKKAELVEVPALKFAMVDGAIEPGNSPGLSPAFQEAVQALYGISYTLKFMCKQRKENAVDYPVMPLEALWWVEKGVFDITRPDNWHWTAMILQPDFITSSLFQEGLDKLRKKRPSPGLDRLRLETFCEGLSLQMMHIGPYAEEPATIEKMKTFAVENGYTLRGKHHEIYLGDPRKADPSRLKTILRHPVERR